MIRGRMKENVSRRDTLQYDGVAEKRHPYYPQEIWFVVPLIKIFNKRLPYCARISTRATSTIYL
jgi:hypothetical protein